MKSSHLMQEVITNWLIQATGVHKFETAIFSCFSWLSRCLYVHNSSQNCRIFTKIVSEETSQSQLRRNEDIFSTIQQKSYDKKIFIFCFGPNLENTFLSFYFFHWATWNFQHRLICDIICWRISKKHSFYIHHFEYGSYVNIQTWKYGSYRHFSEASWWEKKQW